MVSLRLRRSSRDAVRPVDAPDMVGDNPSQADREHLRILEQLRNSFWTGRPVPLHRALRRMTPRKSDLLSLLLVPLAINALMFIFRTDLSLFSMGFMFFFLDPLIADLRFAAYAIDAFKVSIYVPLIQSSPPTPLHWWTGYTVAACLLLVAVFPTRRLIALRYMAGFFGMVQLASQLYLSLQAGRPTIHAQDYLVDTMAQSVFWIAFVPWLFCLTFNLFPFSTLHKLRIVALTVCYQLMFFPVQYAWQAWVLHNGSSIWAALLYFSGGMPFNVLTTLCFYGIGLAWPDAERSE